MRKVIRPSTNIGTGDAARAGAGRGLQAGAACLLRLVCLLGVMLSLGCALKQIAMTDAGTRDRLAEADRLLEALDPQTSAKLDSLVEDAEKNPHPFIDHLADEDPGVASLSASVLGLAKQVVAIRPLLDATRHENFEVHTSAMRALNSLLLHEVPPEDRQAVLDRAEEVMRHGPKTLVLDARDLFRRHGGVEG